MSKFRQDVLIQTMERRVTSLRDAASQTGISASTLSRVMNGKPPTINTLLAICDWLKMPLSFFITYTHENDETDAYDRVIRMIVCDTSISDDLKNVLLATAKAAYQENSK